MKKKQQYSWFEREKKGEIHSAEMEGSLFESTEEQGCLADLLKDTPGRGTMAFSQERVPKTECHQGKGTRSQSSRSYICKEGATLRAIWFQTIESFKANNQHLEFDLGSFFTKSLTSH